MRILSLRPALQAWQVLPLVPPERGFWSPYSGLDAMCGNVLLIDLDELAEEGLIDKEDLPDPLPVTTAQFDKVEPSAACLLQVHRNAYMPWIPYTEAAESEYLILGRNQPPT